MSALSAWRFGTPDGANAAVSTLESLSKQQLITLHDGTTVSWPVRARKPKTRQLKVMAGTGARGGAFWPMLFGLLFLVPLLGAAIGAVAGPLAGKRSDVGIDDDFTKRARDEITPGTSALFILGVDAIQDRVQQASAGHWSELLPTNLSTEQETTLREFAE